MLKATVLKYAPSAGVRSLCIALTVIALAMGQSMVGFGQTVTVVNTVANGYAWSPAFPNPCPNGQPVSNIPSGYHIERPHVIYNASSQQWILWAHYDDANYTTAEALIATSSNQCGPFTIYKEFQPLGEQVRDDYLFEDTDGTAYFIAASNQNGGANDSMAIWRLTSNYLDVDSSAGTTWVFSGQYREAPIVFHAGPYYYLLTSQAAGWFPSQGAYITSSNMLTGWDANAPYGNASTFGGQNANLLTFSGSAGTAYILVLDHLGGNSARDDGSLYLPLQVNTSNRTLTMEWTPAYTVNTTTGAVSIPSRTDLATSTTTASTIGSGCHSYYASDQNYTTEWCASSSSWPQYWQVDLGSTQNINNVDVSWWMYKGSEAYYQYQIQYSNDGANFTTLDKTANRTYGFTSDLLNVNARYLRLNLLDAVLQNTSSDWYTPALWEVKVFGNTPTTINVPNASFESPSTSNFAFTPSGASWTFSGSNPSGSGIALNGKNYTDDNLNTPYGTQVAFIQQSGTISQSIPGFTSGKVYTITVAASQRQNAPSGQSGQTFTISVNGSVIRTITPPQDATGFQDFTATFTATASTNTITFTGTNPNGDDSTILLDNVRISTPTF